MGLFSKKSQPAQVAWTCCICGATADTNVVSILAFVREGGTSQQFAAHASCFRERIAPQAEFDYELLAD